MRKNVNYFRRSICLITVCLCVLFGNTYAGQTAPPATQSYNASLPTTPAHVPGRIVIDLGRDAQSWDMRDEAAVRAMLSARWGVEVRTIVPIGPAVYSLDVPSITDLVALMDRVADDPIIAHIERDFVYRAVVTPNDPLYAEQFYLDRIRASAAWDITTGRPEVLVAVLDSGVYGRHPDFGGKAIVGYDFIQNDGDPADDLGHGTKVAGIIGAVGNNGRGIAGLCWQCSLLSVKVLDELGQGSSATVARAVYYAVAQGARIINLSLGGPTDSRVLHNAVQYAAQQGVLVVAAAGNEGNASTQIIYPAAYPEVMAVGATLVDDEIAPFSSTGAYVDVVAPGDFIVSTSYMPLEVEYYGGDSGTSFAAPQVAGLAALIWSFNPGLSHLQVREIIEATADDLGEVGRDEVYGSGRINAERAVMLAAVTPAFTATATRTPSATPTSTPRATATGTPSRTPTATVTLAPSSTATPTATTPTMLPSPTFTQTSTPTITPLVTSTVPFNVHLPLVAR